MKLLVRIGSRNYIVDSHTDIDRALHIFENLIAVDIRYNSPGYTYHEIDKKDDDYGIPEFTLIKEELFKRLDIDKALSNAQQENENLYSEYPDGEIF